MIDPDRFDALAYVTATAPALGLQFPPERLAEIAAAFALVTRGATPALALVVDADIEPAPVFTPGLFTP